MSAYAKKRYKKQKEKILAETKAWKQTLNGKKSQKLSSARSNKKNPLGRQARVAVMNALRLGKIQRQPCKFCGDKKVEAHHSSYAKEDWLKVMWLCRQHHIIQHTK